MASGHPTIPTPVEYRGVAGDAGYRVGSDGSVWTCLKRVGHGGQGGGSHIEIGTTWNRLKGMTDLGYLRVRIRRRRRLVHHLVLEAFVGPRPRGMEGCHFPDPDRTNNALSNLRWDTRKSNIADRDRMGRQARGESGGKAKLTEAAVRAILADHRSLGLSVKSLSIRHRVSRSCIDHIVSRRNWAHIK